MMIKSQGIKLIGQIEKCSKMKSYFSVISDIDLQEIKSIKNAIALQIL